MYIGQKEINNTTVIFAIAIIILSIFIAMSYAEVQTIKTQIEISDTAPDELRIKAVEEAISVLNENQVELKKTFDHTEELALDTSCDQRMSESFFDSMIIEIIRNNDLKTTGETVQQQIKDYNALKNAGCWANREGGIFE